MQQSFELQLQRTEISRDRFLQRNFLNSVWHFVKFHGLPRKIVVNSVVNSQLKANQPQNVQHVNFISVNFTPLAFPQMADKANKQLIAIIIN